MDRVREVAVRTLLSLVSLYISAVGVELFFDAVPSLNPFLDINSKRIVRAAQRDIPFDSRTRYEVVREYRAAGIEAYPAIAGPGNVYAPTLIVEVDGRQVVPLSGVRSSHTIGDNENGFHLEFQADSFGFNNPSEVYVSNGAEYDYFVGDSFTLGCNVQKGYSFVDIYRREYYGQTITLGYPGLGPLSYLGLIREYIEEGAPRYVYWVYYEGNDLINLFYGESKIAILKSYMNEDFYQHLKIHNDAIDLAIREYINEEIVDYEEVRSSFKDEDSFFDILFLPYLRQGVQTLRQSIHSFRTSFVRGEYASSREYDWDTFEQILQMAKAETETKGGELVFVYLPEYGRYGLAKSRLNWGHFDGGIDHKEQVLDTVKRNEIKLIDAVEWFNKQEAPLALWPFELPYHYNERGNAVVAEAIIGSMGERLASVSQN